MSSSDSESLPIIVLSGGIYSGRQIRQSSFLCDIFEGRYLDQSSKDDSKTFPLPGKLGPVPHAELRTNRLPRPFVDRLHDTTDALLDRLEGLLEADGLGTGIAHISLNKAAYLLTCL